MKKLLLLFFLGFTVQWCSAQAIEVQYRDSLPCAGDDGTSPGTIPPINALDEIIFKPDSNAWKLLDNFYRFSTVRYEGCLFYSNLKKKVIIFISHPAYGLFQYGDETTVAFYFGELLSIDMLDPAILLSYLNYMHGRRPDIELFDIARQRKAAYLERVKKLSDPTGFLSRYQESFYALDLFIEEYSPK